MIHAVRIGGTSIRTWRCVAVRSGERWTHASSRQHTTRIHSYSHRWWRWIKAVYRILVMVGRHHWADYWPRERFCAQRWWDFGGPIVVWGVRWVQGIGVSEWLHELCAKAIFEVGRCDGCCIHCIAFALTPFCPTVLEPHLFGLKKKKIEMFSVFSNLHILFYWYWKDNWIRSRLKGEIKNIFNNSETEYCITEFHFHCIFNVPCIFLSISKFVPIK